MNQEIQIRDKKIPIQIKNYRNAKTIKMYFKLGVLQIHKPTWLSQNKMIAFLKQNESAIYQEYKKIQDIPHRTERHWQTGEVFFYEGEDYTIVREEIQENKVSIYLDKKEKTLNLIVPIGLPKEMIDKTMKKLLKQNTEAYLQDRLPYWSEKTDIRYKQWKVADATTRFGSCQTKTKVLHFTSRLIMLPSLAIDGIIVHELCHIIHPNHGKEFYDLVHKYIPNYNEIDQWLKKNGTNILF